ncbi:hypothetical protein [Sphingomonas sp. S2-65]|uniref:hypothetical protein n=1 Tax=Sphingomonas sp. S2-65 TaxID=2903960 RepID=UPI001F3C541D|nr:hypothetical protein [Sphingomonas sp. S2-65]UYY58001.1 hypothetical protein LZ586_15255 [Sphingomonas sp. S2-65]
MNSFANHNTSFNANDPQPDHPGNRRSEFVLGAERAAMYRTDPRFGAFPPVTKVVIVRAPDGDQLRTQITGRKSIRTIGYPSKKMSRNRYAEGATEILRLPEEEVRVDIVKAIAQPLRVEALVGGAWWSHLPDFSNLMADGSRVLIDAKRHWSDFRRPEARKQSFLGQLAADAIGYRYERIVLANAGGQQRRENIDEIQASRFVHVPKHLIARAAAAVSRGPISLGSLASMLHPINGRSMAYALMVQRVVEIDLEARLTERSECRAVPPLRLAMPSLRR